MQPKYTEMPCDRAAEGAVIGSMLVGPECISQIVEWINKDDFWTIEAQCLFDCIINLWREKQPVDAVLVRNRMVNPSTEMLNYMQAAVDTVPSAANAVYYAKLVHRKSTERKLISLVEQAQDIVGSNVSLEDKMSSISKLSEAVPTDEPRGTSLQEITRQYLMQVEDGGGLTTGFGGLDRIIGGFKNTHFILLAGRPAMGKSSLLLDFYIHCARIGAKPYEYSLEMASDKTVQRMLRNVSRYKERTLDKSRPEIIEAGRLISLWTGWIEDKVDYKIDNLCASILAQKEKNDIGICFVDYLQLIEGRGRSRYDQISMISRELKKTAIRADIPIVVVSQLSRACELRNNHRPIMSDLRESGNLEQDADVILFLHRDDYYRQKEKRDAKFDGLAEVIVAKNREGETGTLDFIWLPEITSFAEKARDENVWLDNSSENRDDNVPF
jgi:replicative DNA helicase